MKFADAGGWFALFVPEDINHAAAVTWFAQQKQLLFTTDYVVDETLTLLRSRGQATIALTLGQKFFDGSLATIYYLTEADIRQAWQVFTRYADKEWSFTDCTSKVVIENFGITEAFAFDHHFRQFGTVVRHCDHRAVTLSRSMRSIIPEGDYADAVSRLHHSRAGQARRQAL